MSHDIQTLVKIGGREWKKDNFHRVYFNNLAELYGLRTSHYKSGNISAATLRGEKISNSLAGEIATALAESKVWYDVADGKFHGRMARSRRFDGHEAFPQIVEEIKRRAADARPACGAEIGETAADAAEHHAKL